jgi:flagellar hook-basal body complex protein FliE
MPYAINNFSSAAAAYARARTGLSAAAGGPEDGAAGEAGFAALVQRALSAAVASGEKSERLSLAAMGDQADLTQVVTAVAEAETVLNTVVAVRDRVVEAYKDIMRMPI